MSISNLLSGRSPAFDFGRTFSVETACGVERAIGSGAGIAALECSSTLSVSSVCGSVESDAEPVGPLLGTSFSTFVSVFIIASQGHAILFGHSGMAVALCCFDAALVRFTRSLFLAHALVSAGQHPEGVSFV